MLQFSCYLQAYMEIIIWNMYSKHSIFFEIDCCSLQYKKNFYITFLFYLNVNYIFRLKFVSYLHQQILYYDLCVCKQK